MNEFQCLRPAVNHFGFFPPLPPPVVAEDTPADELSPLSSKDHSQKLCPHSWRDWVRSCSQHIPWFKRRR